MDRAAVGTATDSAVAASIAPLVELLRRELKLAGIRPPAARPSTLRAFTQWYLRAVELLDAHCAGEARQAAMTRGEVELMCRCALSARNLEEAIGLCADYCAMLSPRAGKLSLHRRAAVATLQLDSLRSNPTTASSLVDITGLFAFHQLFQWLIGLDLKLLQVGIGPVQREDVMPFLRLFRAPVLFGGEVYTMAFPQEMLQLPVVRSSGEFNAFFSVFPCGVFESNRRSLAGQVSSLLSASLRQGAGTPSQAQLATALGLSLSTFRRQLAASGQSFRELRETCLQDSARQWLERSDLSITEIANRLGYSDSGAFRRAFHQWTGMAPSDWRIGQHGSTSDTGGS